MNLLKLTARLEINGISTDKLEVQLNVKLHKYTNKHLKQLIGCRVRHSRELVRRSNLKRPMDMAVFSFQKSLRRNKLNRKKVLRIFEKALKLHLRRLLEIPIRII